ncbi:hypothetical protein GPECTOR_39g401 [Gonium pectorale]|uniref:Expansin-like EG45 domain-containing protein n=1 Tax=Gonium pectorale TaxID=33097 RepID=A0A150GAN6_GONPE|nr:hypothetical protein GPECTOR_39g401 [Gonium pectorale]|eukprot:KXZ46907.1 hypothetical protein GPECTOR_39g401 [Gonium pectorale]
MTARSIFLLSSLAAALLLASQCSAELIINPLPLGNWTNGSALFFGGPTEGQDDPFDMRLPGGACGYGEMDSKMWPFFHVASISPNSELVRDRPQASCGTCLEVKCTSTDPKVCSSTSSITVVVTDECPDCAANQLNLHAFAFEQIARLERGSAVIQYRQVRVDGFRVVQGGWIRLSLKSVASDAGIVRVELTRSLSAATGSNSTEPVPSVGAKNIGAPNSSASSNDPAEQLLLDVSAPDSEWPKDSSTNTTRQWRPMDNTYGAEWEMSALAAPPYDLRLTDAFGRQVVLAGVIKKAGAVGEFPSLGQFGGLDNKTIQSHQRTSVPVEEPTAPPTTPKPSTVAKNGTIAAAPTATKAPAPKPALTAKTPTVATTPKPSPAGTLGAVRRLLHRQRGAGQGHRQLRQGTRGQAKGPMP